MKSFTFGLCAILATLAASAAPVLADVQSLRGSEAILVTGAAPAKLKIIKDKENVPRTFEEQPPVVPHESEKYAINLKENKCLDCHMKEPGKDKAKSVEMSKSHFTDRNGNKHDKPVGARHFCTQCHVPQVDAPPLVGTTFQSVSK